MTIFSGWSGFEPFSRNEVKTLGMRGMQGGNKHGDPIFLLHFFGLRLKETGTYFTRHQAPRVKSLSVSCKHRLQKDVLESWCWACWLRLASWRWFSGFRVSSIFYSTNLACLFTDWIRFSCKKSAGVRAIGAKMAAQLPTFLFFSVWRVKGTLFSKTPCEYWGQPQLHIW